MINAGQFHTLKILRRTDFGMYLDDGDKGILLPNRFVSPSMKEGDDIKVFVYHDSEDRLIATTETPKGIAGDIVKLQVVDVTPQGAFMNWGLMKDLFVPLSQQKSKMRLKGEYLVKLYVDEKTGRIAATEKIERFLSNETLTVKEMDVVTLTTYRRTDIGYVMIINNLHEGILHHNEIYRTITEGDTFEGFVKKIYSDNKIDVSAGKPGLQRMDDASEKVLDLLHRHGGFLPYHDKSDPDDIYEFFSMSKKTFKASIGNLYKQKRISILENGIKLN